MRHVPALVLGLSIAAAASLYTPAAKAGVYVGIGVPAPVVVARGPVVAPRFVAGVPAPAPYYYAPPVWFGAGYFGPRVWGYGHFHAHSYYGAHGWGYVRR